MPAQARKDHVREGEKGVYHCWSRCVQRIYLFGVDPLTKQDFSHRKQWLLQLLMLLVQVFAIDVGAFHILSNHIHLILCLRPDIAERWTPEEIAWRWKMAWSSWNPSTGTWERRVTDDEIADVVSRGPEHIERLRRCLMSLSWFMHRLKEPLAKLANAEMGTSGHMWAERFGCRELEKDTLSGLVYTDLQQLKCGAVDQLVDSEFASIKARIETFAHMQAQESLDDFKSRKGAEHYDLSEQLLEQLVVDSCLTPFSGESPFLNAGAMERRLILPDDNRELLVPGWYTEKTARDAMEADAVQESDVESTLSDIDQASKTGESNDQQSIVGASELSGGKGTDVSPARFFDRSVEETDRTQSGGARAGKKTYRKHREFLPRLVERLKESRSFHELSRGDYLDLVKKAAVAWKAEERDRDPLHSKTESPRMGDDGSLKLLRVSLRLFDGFFTTFIDEHYGQRGDRGEPPDDDPVELDTRN